jgi:hypothetical protein
MIDPSDIIIMLLFLGSQISGAFSGIISGAISTTLDGHNGMRG